MKKRLVNKDPFSNGSEHRSFEYHCCEKCIKSSEPRDGGDGLVFYINQRDDGLPKCSIQRDIMTRMFSNNPIKQETIDICDNFVMHGTLCPHMKTERPKQVKKQPQNQQSLEL